MNRFSGYVDYTCTIDIGDADGIVLLDLGKVKYVVEVFVNGNKIGGKLWPPFKFDVTSAVKTGANTVRVRVGNLSANEMAQFDDKKMLCTWGWEYQGRYPHDFNVSHRRPADDIFDAGLFGPVTVRTFGRFLAK